MKIGILTQPLHANYGGLLQNYALQQTLIQVGHEVETIDWDVNHGMRETLSNVKLKMLHAIFPNKYPPVYYQLNEKEKAIIQRNTNYFIKKYIKRTEVVHSHKNFARQATSGNYGGFVVGSDQCWRPCYNIFLSAMFLDFVQDSQVRRVAYAASFGTDKWEFTAQQTTVCKSLAQKFDLVTVREDTGMELCKEHFGVDAAHVLEPTMLLTKEDYIRLVEKEREPKSNGTLFNYILDPSAKKSAFIKNVAESKGFEPFKVLPKFQAETRTKDDIKNRIEDCVFPSVTAWLRAFMDAEMTIVDSFHGMVFSIIFNKPFWVIGNIVRGMSRFTSLLKMFHLEDRLINVDNLDDVEFSKPIDWNVVNAILEEKRCESKTLLLNEFN